jgi:hypothetical protein
VFATTHRGLQQSRRQAGKDDRIKIGLGYESGSVQFCHGSSLLTVGIPSGGVLFIVTLLISSIPKTWNKLRTL